MATPIPVNEARFTIDELLQATGGVWIGPMLSEGVQGVVTDSRAARAGRLFVALSGERHDAHRFLPDVARAGARVALVRTGTVLPPGLSAIAVTDTTRALGELARFHRLRWNKPVVAITGSAGKTTTKELTAAALSALGMRVLKTSGNLNNAIGVPMTLLELTDAHDIAVIEAGTSGPGEIAWLAEIARPDVAVVTEVAVAHTAGLGTVTAVAHEKTALLRALNARGTAIWNADNAALAQAVGTLAAKQLRFGTHGDVEVRLCSYEATADLFERCVFESQPGGAPFEARLRLLGGGAALDAAAALAVVRALRGDGAWPTAAQGMAAVAPTPGRMVAIEGDDRVLLIDDTYNANPISCERSLQSAAALAKARHGRVIAVLADMKELGDESVAQHRRIGRLAVELDVAVFVGCGGEMAAACDAAITETARHRVPHLTRVVHVLDPLQAASVVRAQLQEGDVVLIKGSRSMAMERVVHELAPKGAAA